MTAWILRIREHMSDIHNYTERRSSGEIPRSLRGLEFLNLTVFELLISLGYQAPNLNVLEIIAQTR